MTIKNMFNRLSRSAAPIALVFATAVTAAGCAITPPSVQMGYDNISYIQQGVAFYRQTGASPVNYDACGALQDAVEGRANSGVGGLAGGAIGGVVAHQLGGNPLTTIAGVIGGALIGNEAGKYAQSGDINQLNRDCQLQQAISNASGGSVRGGMIVHQPGGIYRRY